MNSWLIKIGIRNMFYLYCVGTVAYPDFVYVVDMLLLVKSVQIVSIRYWGFEDVRKSWENWKASFETLKY